MTEIGELLTHQAELPNKNEVNFAIIDTRSQFSDLVGGALATKGIDVYKLYKVDNIATKPKDIATFLNENTIYPVMNVNNGKIPIEVVYAMNIALNYHNNNDNIKLYMSQR